MHATNSKLNKSPEGTEMQCNDTPGSLGPGGSCCNPALTKQQLHNMLQSGPVRIMDLITNCFQEELG